MKTVSLFITSFVGSFGWLWMLTSKDLVDVLYLSFIVSCLVLSGIGFLGSFVKARRKKRNKQIKAKRRELKAKMNKEFLFDVADNYKFFEVLPDGREVEVRRTIV